MEIDQWLFFKPQLQSRSLEYHIRTAYTSHLENTGTCADRSDIKQIIN